MKHNVRMCIVLVFFMLYVPVTFAQDSKVAIQTALAEAYVADKDYENAIAHYREILEQDPKNINARIALAEVLSWQKQYESAIDEYETVLDIDPENQKSKRGLAEVLVWHKSFAAAEGIYKELLAKDPRHVDLYALLGNVLSWQKKYEEAVRYYELALAEKDGQSLAMSYGKALLYAGHYVEAQNMFKQLLERNPLDREAKECLADVFSYNKEFSEAIVLYRELLHEKDDVGIKKKMADVLSWDKKYDVALDAYDDVLADAEDVRVRVQKARILGWHRKYQESLAEYNAILSHTDDDLIRLEMTAKKAYWHGRVYRAIDSYKKLIERDPENLEAMFDLAQTYAYQSLWRDASRSYNTILSVSPDHFRAQEALEKVSLIANAFAWDSGFDFFEADSSGRQQDIKRYALRNAVTVPFKHAFSLAADHQLVFRSFSDFNDVVENVARVGITFVDSPLMVVESFYESHAYTRDIDSLHLFGLDSRIRFSDYWSLNLSFDRKGLENNSTVIRDGSYCDTYKERITFDVTKRLKIGVDYVFAYYSDSNSKHEPGADLEYVFSLEPYRFSATYRYFYRDFDEKYAHYFSPKGFSVNALSFQWRQYLNKEEIFFGANNLFYDLAYDVSLDSEDIVSHSFRAGLHWDVHKRCSLSLQAAHTNTSASVYDDANITTSLKYYF